MISRSPFRVFLFFLVATLSIAFFFQCVFLPYLAPSLHAQRGLMIGHDSIAMEEVARARSTEEISTMGWKALIPYAGMDYYLHLIAYFYKHLFAMPWIMIPLHALTYALGGLFLFLILTRFTSTKSFALLGTLPMILLPSSWSLFTQLQRDCFVVMGAMGFLWSSLNILQSCLEQKRIRIWDLLVFSLTTYTLLCFRTYLIYLFKPLVFVAMVLFAGYSIFNRPKLSLMTLFYNALCLVILSGWVLKLRPNEIATHQNNAEQMAEEVTSQNPYSPTLDWHQSSWAPNFLEEKAKYLVLIRKGAVNQAMYGTLNKDINVEFHRLGDLFKYIPRALQLSLFSPFPSDWLGTSGSAFRKVAGVETLLWYILLLVSVSILILKRNPYLFTLFCLCLYVTLSYPYALVNVGTMYRLKLIWQFPIIGMGIVTLLSLFPVRYSIFDESVRDY